MLNFPRWKIITVLLVCLLGFLFALPNFLSPAARNGIPDFLPSDTINLGLDLQGGSHLLLEVDLSQVISERLAALQDDVRQTLRRNRIGYTALTQTSNGVSFRVREPAELDRAEELVEELAQPITNNLFAQSFARDIAVDTEDGERVLVTLTDEGIEARRQRVVQQSVEVIRRRIDELGTREPVIQRQGEDRILVQVPGLDDPERLKELLGTTARLTFHLVDTTVSQDEILSGRLPPGTITVPMAPPNPGEVAIRRRVMVSGENLQDASAGFDQYGRPSVNLQFDSTGARQFGRATAENVGRPFAIILDDEVLSAPVINEPIPSGRAQITGTFTIDSASNLAILLNAGALPAELTVLEERTVGPGLGQDSIEAGKIAAILGLVLVVVFIILSYGRFGLAANVALMINILLILGALSLLQATLTLPGIAGIVLTMGMAVDANVLVFERIREEISAGRTPLQSVDTGYSQALSTILDANITTLIAAVILFQFGSGPVKGFAVTLAIGIVTSVFTAVVVTRMMLAVWLRRKRPQTIEV